MTNPQLGYGKPTEATIDQVNIWMRGQPWYQQQMRAWGQDPGRPTLTKEQSRQILRMAQQQGVVVDEGDMEIDNHGNFNPKGHKLRNTLIVAGIAGATLATMGAAGAFSGAAGAGGAGAGGGAATGGTLASSTIGSGFVPGVAGGAGLAGAGAAGGGAAAGGALASSAVGSGMMPAIAGGAGVGAGGGGVGLGTVLSHLPDIGEAASAIAGGRAQGRIGEANANYQHDLMRMQAARLLEEALQGRARVDLDQRAFALNAPQQRARNSVRGDALANLQDPEVIGPIVGTKGRIPQITGGLRPSLFSDNTRQLGAEMSRQALLSQMQGDNFEKMPAPNIPEPTPMPKRNGFDRVLDTMGTVGGIVGAFDDDSLLNRYGRSGARPNVPQIPRLPHIPDLGPVNPGAMPGFGPGPRQPFDMDAFNRWRGPRVGPDLFPNFSSGDY